MTRAGKTKRPSMAETAHLLVDQLGAHKASAAAAVGGLEAITQQAATSAKAIAAMHEQAEHAARRLDPFLRAADNTMAPAFAATEALGPVIEYWTRVVFNPGGKRSSKAARVAEKPKPIARRKGSPKESAQASPTAQASPSRTDGSTFGLPDPTGAGSMLRAVTAMSSKMWGWR